MTYRFTILSSTLLLHSYELILMLSSLGILIDCRLKLDESNIKPSVIVYSRLTGDIDFHKVSKLSLDNYQINGILWTGKNQVHTITKNGSAHSPIPIVIQFTIMLYKDGAYGKCVIFVSYQFQYGGCIVGVFCIYAMTDYYEFGINVISAKTNKRHIREDIFLTPVSK